MKKLILLALIIFPSAVMAQVEVCNSSFTVNTVSVSSYSATLVDSSAIKMMERKWIEVQNISTDVVHCMQSSGVTTSTGRLIAASGGAWSLNLSDRGYSVSFSTYTPFATTTDYAMGIYCIGSGANIPSSVALSQCK